MNYVVNVNGIDIVIESHTAESRQQDNYEQRNRLMSYYKMLLKIKGIEADSEKNKVLNYIVDNMTEQNAQKKADSFEQAQMKRILTYATKFAELKLRQEPPEDEEPISKAESDKVDQMADALLEVLDAVADDNIDNNETVEINDNKFIYEKDTLNIRDHVQKLYDIGKQSKGNTWTIYLDDKGELVIY